MNEFPPNSNKDKEPAKPDKKIQAVTTGEVIRRKKSLGKRLVETFGGSAKGVWSYVVLDVLIPAAKDMVADATSQGIERMLFGETRSSNRRSGGRPTGSNGYVAYNRFGASGSGRRDAETRSISRQGRATHDFDEIILATRIEADEVLDRLSDLIDRYESASVADLYELVAITGQYTDDKWGWTDTRGMGVTRIRNGYLLDLPKPEPLN